MPNVVPDADPRRPVDQGAKSGPFPLELVICEHADDHNVPIQAKLKPYSS